MDRPQVDAMIHHCSQDGYLSWPRSVNCIRVKIESTNQRQEEIIYQTLRQQCTSDMSEVRLRINELNNLR